MVLLRYLDVCLVLATAPFVLIAGLPLLGYLIATVAWLLTRLGTAFVQERALRIGDPKLRAGLQVGSMMGRIWIVALAILRGSLRGRQGRRDHGGRADAGGLHRLLRDVLLRRATRSQVRPALRRGGARARHERDSDGGSRATGPGYDAPDPGAPAGDVEPPKKSIKKLLLILGGVWIGGVIVAARDLRHRAGATTATSPRTSSNSTPG